MEESSHEKRVNISLRRERKPSCTLCKNHGMRSNLKGHKRLCPFLTCDCEPCVKGRKRRVVMRRQVRLRRKQMKDIRSRSNSATPVEPFRGKKDKEKLKCRLNVCRSLPPMNSSIWSSFKLEFVKHKLSSSVLQSVFSICCQFHFEGIVWFSKNVYTVLVHLLQVVCSPYLFAWSLGKH